MIYLDHNATTPLDERVLEAMLPYLRQQFGNAASRQHAVGRRAAEAVERARGQVAELIGADPRELTFTSGATEANNLAIRGLATYEATAVGREGRHIVTSSIEHPSVLEPCHRLEREGWSVTYVDPTAAGVVEPAAVAEAVRPGETVLVSVMAANHETGVLNDVAAIAAACRAKAGEGAGAGGVFVHTDATQAVGKVALDVDTLGVDMLSLSAHKFYGPQGVGALFARRKRPRVRLEPLMNGGGHERGVRPGTLNLPGIVGLGEAAALVGDADAIHAAGRGLTELRGRLEQALLANVADAAVNGGDAQRLPDTTNISLGSIDAERLIAATPGVAVSSASACTTAAMQPSRVLRRMGLSTARARASIRCGLGRSTTTEQIDEAARLLIEAAINQDPAETACDPRL